MTTHGIDGALAAPSMSSTARRGDRWWRRLGPLAPAGLILFGFFFVPLAVMLVYSFWTTNARLDVVPVFTLANYEEFFRNATYVRTLLKTLVMGAAVTAACLVLAFGVAYFLARYVSRRWARIALLVIIVPFWTSYLLRVYSWQAILGERGALNQLLMGLGIIQEPSRLFVYNDIGTFIVLTYVYLPFAVLVLYAALERFDFTQVTAAQDLGARPDQAFRHVLIPQIRPGIITASILVLIPILGEYLTPTIVGGASGLLIANLISTFFKNALFSEGAAIGFMIVGLVTLLLIAFRRYLRIEDVYARG